MSHLSQFTYGHPSLVLSPFHILVQSTTTFCPFTCVFGHHNSLRFPFLINLRTGQPDGIQQTTRQHRASSYTTCILHHDQLLTALTYTLSS